MSQQARDLDKTPQGLSFIGQFSQLTGLEVPLANIPNTDNLIDAAARATDFSGNVDIDEIEKEPETWVEPVAAFIWKILIDHGIKIVLIFSAYLLLSLIFRKLYLAGLVTRWKSLLGYLDSLEKIRDLLEADYELELWSEPEFCKKYLEVFEAFRRFRSIANRDHLGNSLIDDRKRQEEAKPLYQFFDVDYELHDRLVYALDGVEWKDEEEGAEQNEDGQENQEKEMKEGGGQIDGAVKNDEENKEQNEQQMEANTGEGNVG